MAVGRFYPAAASSAATEFAPGELPKYGALGAFGAQGGASCGRPADARHRRPYGFERGKVYNLDGSRYIAEMQSRGSGAHNDIAQPEVAHAMWSAVLV